MFSWGNGFWTSFRLFEANESNKYNASSFLFWRPKFWIFPWQMCKEDLDLVHQFPTLELFPYLIVITGRRFGMCVCWYEKAAPSMALKWLWFDGFNALPTHLAPGMGWKISQAIGYLALRTRFTTALSIAIAESDETTTLTSSSKDFLSQGFSKEYEGSDRVELHLWSTLKLRH